MPGQIFDFSHKPATRILIDSNVSEDNADTLTVEVEVLSLDEAGEPVSDWMPVQVVEDGALVDEVGAPGTYPLDWQDTARYRITFPTTIKYQIL